MSEVAALILAAGRATRFGAAAETSKVLAPFAGKPLVRWVAEAALASRAHRTVVVVTGQAEAGVGAALRSLDLRCIHNPAFATGMASSLQAGLAALPPGADGALVLLADMPRITAAMIDALIARFEAEAARPDAVVPVYQGRQGNPVLLGRGLFAAIASLTGDQGARALLREGAGRILSCPIDDAAIEQDVDTPVALAALEAEMTGPERIQAAERPVSTVRPAAPSSDQVSSEIIVSISSAGSGGAK